MTTRYLIGNWKSHQNLTETMIWLEEFAKLNPTLPEDLKVIISLPFTDLATFNHKVSELGLPLITCAQDVSHLAPGKHTGEVTANMLSELVSYCIVGHSERRREFNETSVMVADKVKYLLENSITPIVCLDRPYLEEQIKELFSRSLEVSKCLYVYEPVAAVGTGNPESPAEANRVCHEISFLLDNNAPILYGGSVNSVNAPLYVDENRLDGVLVGTDSLDPKSFYDILVSLS